MLKVKKKLVFNLSVQNRFGTVIDLNHRRKVMING